MDFINFTFNTLLAHGFQYGHRKAETDTRVYPYLLGERGGMQVFDLTTTVRHLRYALALLVSVSARRGNVLLINPGQIFLDKFDTALADPFLNIRYTQRKLPGVLSNFRGLKRFYVRDEDLPALRRLPAFVLIFNSFDHHAVREAARLNIPQAAFFDSNTNPVLANFYPLPANDDSLLARVFHTRLVLRALHTGFEQFVRKWLSYRNRAVGRQSLALADVLRPRPAPKSAVISFLPFWPLYPSVSIQSEDDGCFRPQRLRKVIVCPSLRSLKLGSTHRISAFFPVKSSPKRNLRDYFSGNFSLSVFVSDSRYTPGQNLRRPFSLPAAPVIKQWKKTPWLAAGAGRWLPIRTRFTVGPRGVRERLFRRKIGRHPISWAGFSSHRLAFRRSPRLLEATKVVTVKAPVPSSPVGQSQALRTPVPYRRRPRRLPLQKTAPHLPWFRRPKDRALVSILRYGVSMNIFLSRRSGRGERGGQIPRLATGEPMDSRQRIGLLEGISHLSPNSARRFLALGNYRLRCLDYRFRRRGIKPVLGPGGHLLLSPSSEAKLSVMLPQLPFSPAVKLEGTTFAFDHLPGELEPLGDKLSVAVVSRRFRRRKSKKSKAIPASPAGKKSASRVTPAQLRRR